jgi:MYM-type zinc finger with FCS sequence motif
MSRELEFTGWWEGNTVYSCDNCHQSEEFPFDSEDIDSRAHRTELRKKGWNCTKVNGEWKDFCSEKCRNDYIKKNP